MAKTRKKAKGKKVSGRRHRRAKARVKRSKETGRRRSAKTSGRRRRSVKRGTRRRNAPPKRKRAAKKKPFNEKNVIAEFAAAEDEDKEYIIVDREEDWPGEHFEISFSGGEYHVYKDDDAAREAAIVAVKQDLEQEPEIFNQSFIESHIDEEALKEWVYQAELENDYVRELADDPSDFWDMAERFGMDVPDDDTDEYDEPSDEAIEDLTERYAKDQAEDPMRFLEDIYGREDAVKKAIEVAGIDIDAAAEEAVNVDGWPHFLARYDGNYDETPSGFVYFRVN